MRKGAINPDLVCVAEIVGAHGIKGMVKLKIFCDDPDSIWDYMPLCSSDGSREFEFTDIAQHQTLYLASIDGVEDRNESEKLRGTKLYVHRDKLPKIDEDDTYYYSDLKGLTAIENGKTVGKVINVHDFGSGDLLELMMNDTGKTLYLPFKNEYVPHVDIKAGEITVIIPEVLL